MKYFKYVDTYNESSKIRLTGNNCNRLSFEGQ